jgi:hypothetical protein
MASTPTYSWPTPDNTDLVKNGALAIRTLGNAIDSTTATMTPKSIVDAKGDLIAASANDTPARLAVGANGETLVADSSTTTGLRYTENYAAGKNKIINGDFGIWQRGTSFTTNSAYTADRFQMVTTPGEGTVSQQTFTPGAAPVAGYESQFFLRYNATASNLDPRIIQRIEDVRTFAGQTITVSFWAKSATSNALSAIDIRQDFGSGGSTVVILTSPSFTLTSSWVRYSTTISIPSISGKTIGTNSNLRITFDLANSTAFDFDLWGVQVEAGSVATAFQTASGSIAGELALAQRYYYRAVIPTTPARFGVGMVNSTTTAEGFIQFPTTMRSNPTALEQSGTAADYSIFSTGSVATNCSAVPTFNTATPFGSSVTYTVASGLTGGQAVIIRASNTSAYLGWSAEL